MNSEVLGPLQLLPALARKIVLGLVHWSREEDSRLPEGAELGRDAGGRAQEEEGTEGLRGRRQVL